jgi:hypothetical protein
MHGYQGNISQRPHGIGKQKEPYMDLPPVPSPFVKSPPAADTHVPHACVRIIHVKLSPDKTNGCARVRLTDPGS